MTDDFEESLRESLAGAVPTPPDEPGRAAGARSYSRRVRRTKAALAVGAAAVVVGAIVVVPTVLASSDGNHTATPGIGTPPTKKPLAMPPVAHPYVCSLPRSGQLPPEHGVVAAGAVLARICPINPQAVRWTAPAEPLVTGVEALATQLNHLPKTGLPTCTPEPQPAYRLTFQYPDGHTVSVQGEAGNCNTVSAGPMLREGGSTLLRDYLAALRAQRDHFAAPQRQMTPLTCPADPEQTKTVLIDGRGPGLTRAIACSYPFLGDPSASASGALSAQQVQQLNSDLAGRATRQPETTAAVRRCESMRGGVGVVSIVGVNAWGDRVELSAQCSVYSFMDRNGTWFWTPTRRTAAMLKSVLHQPAQPTGRVTGRLLGVGGLAGGVTPFEWAGTITLRSAGAVYHATAGDDGRFAAAVPPGRYRVTGRSPSYNDSLGQCNPLHPYVTVHAHQTVRVNVYCQLK